VCRERTGALPALDFQGFAGKPDDARLFEPELWRPGGDLAGCGDLSFDPFPLRFEKRVDVDVGRAVRNDDLEWAARADDDSRRLRAPTRERERSTSRRRCQSGAACDREGRSRLANKRRAAGCVLEFVYLPAVVRMRLRKPAAASTAAATANTSTAGSAPQLMFWE